MNRTCILCGCLCMTGLRIDRQMLCRGCEAALLKIQPQPVPELLRLYEDVPELRASR